ncbi:MAG: hypothetical protein IJC63_08370, partial [Myxococcaceae bacterium]|nr:hypothetical protein [Myxococcaceae bacterium]
MAKRLGIIWDELEDFVPGFLFQLGLMLCAVNARQFFIDRGGLGDFAGHLKCPGEQRKCFDVFGVGAETNLQFGQGPLRLAHREILGGDFLIKNLKMNKVTVIMQEIGKQPVLSFGNSTGDASMAEYVTTN